MNLYNRYKVQFISLLIVSILLVATIFVLFNPESKPVNEVSGNPVKTANRRIEDGHPVPRTGNITGSVFSFNSQLPLPEASLRLFSGDRVIFETSTDQGGKFLLSGIKPGSYTLKAQKEKFGSRYQRVIVKNSKESKIDFYLVPAAGIFGSVHYSSGEPVIDCELATSEFQTPKYKYFTRTDKNGHFRFSDLHPGQSYEVSLILKNGLKFVKSVARVYGGKETGPVEFIIDSSSSISGYTISDSTGQVAGGVPLTLQFLDNNILSTMNSKSNDEGFYIFEELPKSVVRIQANDDRYWKAETEVNVHSNARIENVNLYLKNPARIEGVLTTQSGDPIEDVTVDLTQNCPAWTLTDSTGTFQFDSITETAIDLNFSRDGSDLFVTPDTIKHLFTPGETVKKKFICDIMPLNISGVVTDLADEPLSDASVHLDFRKSFKVVSVLSDKSDAQGKFSFNFMSSGLLDQYEISVSREGYSPETLLLGDFKTDVPDINIKVKLDTGETISGWVRTFSGDPCEGINVKAMSEFSPRVVSSTVSNHQGAFKIDGLIPGNYVLTAWNTPDSILKQGLASRQQLKGMAQAKFNTVKGVKSGSTDVVITQSDGRDLNITVLDKTTGEALNHFTIICRSRTKKMPEGDFRHVNVSSGSGKVTVPNLSFDEYEISVMSERQLLAKQTVLLEPGELPLDIIIEVDQSFVVRGKVCNLDGSKVFENVYIRAAQPPDSNRWRSAHSDKNGLFSFSGLSEGLCFFEFNIYHGSANIVHKKTMELRKGMPDLLIKIDDVLQKLRGKVVDAHTEEAVAGATVYTNAQLNNVFTDNNGRFELEISSEVTFNCIVKHTEYSMKNIENLIAKDLLSSTKEWIIELDKGTDLVGIVYDYNGSAMGYNSIELLGESNREKATTNSLGEFEFKNLAPDHYVVTSNRLDSSNEKSYFMKGVSLKDSQERSIRMDWMTGVNINAQIESYEAYGPNIMVRLESSRLSGHSDSKIYKSIPVSSSGNFTFTNVPPGKYRIYSSLFSKVINVSNQNLDLEFYLESEADLYE